MSRSIQRGCVYKFNTKERVTISYGPYIRQQQHTYPIPLPLPFFTTPCPGCNGLCRSKEIKVAKENIWSDNKMEVFHIQKGKCHGIFPLNYEIKISFKSLYKTLRCSLSTCTNGTPNKEPANHSINCASILSTLWIPYHCRNINCR